jgi:hypothetical protein
VDKGAAVGFLKSIDEQDATPKQRWEYFAYNLEKVPGMRLQNDFNKAGQGGWEFVAAVEGYAIFKRPV